MRERAVIEADYVADTGSLKDKCGRLWLELMLDVRECNGLPPVSATTARAAIETLYNADVATLEDKNGRYFLELMLDLRAGGLT